MLSPHREYRALEDEFREALQGQDARQNRLVQELEGQRHGVQEVLALLRAAEAREQQAVQAVGDLTAVVKEQKERMAALVAERAQADHACAAAAHALQQVNQETAARAQELAACRDELQAGQTKIAALENVVRGLREERALWSKELAAQGAALAADRGGLEARVASLTGEVALLKQQNAEAADTLQIKAKLLDDQIDSLRKAKGALAEREREMRHLKEEQLRREDDLKDRLEAERALSQQLQDDLQAAHEKRSKLKSALSDTAAELDTLRKEAAAFKAAEQDRVVRLAEVELDLQHTRSAAQRRERELLAERNAAVAALETADARLAECATLFQRQLDAKQLHVASLTEQLEQERVLLAAANARVRAAEDDMRALLIESERRQQAAQLRSAQLRNVLRELESSDNAAALLDL